MTILECIKTVLENNPAGLTSKEVYNQIIAQELYHFGAKNPVGVVNGELRRHCAGLDFPTAHPVKYFSIVGYEGKQIRFAIKGQHDQPQTTSPTKPVSNSEVLPEERIALAYDEHILTLKQQLLDAIMNQHPSFFERMVVDLLLKMGYGYDRNSGVVTGGSHDGGIDGIIYEDKLGLDLIYIQAKRYAANNKVGRKEVQAFIGAMENIQKGVFITTSSFTKEAKTFGEQQQQKHVKLIDGIMLTDLMVKYGVGVDTVQSFCVYKLSTDYFIE